MHPGTAATDLAWLRRFAMRVPRSVRYRMPRVVRVIIRHIPVSQVPFTRPLGLPSRRKVVRIHNQTEGRGGGPRLCLETDRVPACEGLREHESQQVLLDLLRYDLRENVCQVHVYSETREAR